ncbi:exosome complex exonuclease-like protein Rrp6 [Massariosphaeria phaeospora]|uniref:Exosome complex exonuclease-like protein Rrp6 n=1 Tax=Massariosphaeria phaeospora TaxID=100035 RepID=A0A7C8I9X3_9PLEO|nr:exosome complex exonuclease-like protein Rrp6 [Massariosphaeria phaeospora]
MDSFKTLQESITAALVSTTRSTTRIGGADIAFQRSLDPAIGDALDAQNARLLQLAQRLLQNAAASSDAVGPPLPDVDAIDGNWKGVVDVIDSLLEKADTSLDEYTGVVRRVSNGGEQSSAAPASRRSNFAVTPKNTPKPQLSFEHVPKNNETGGFRPLMAAKPHAKVPMAQCLQTFKDSKGRDQYPHPYQAEIEAYEYPQSVYQKSEPQAYLPFDESTRATFVDTPEAVAMMLAELKTAKEIAIDLEHHDNRSYIGMVSLMQISTRNKDWIVDTLKPWRRQLECLNEVFADPNILKVLHGAFMDIVWLQRDLGLYVVGLFDTYHAARALGYPGAGLAFLLEKFVNFKAQKQYQLADWRTRPLSKELFTYAQADTHFLLYIFDNMRNELVEKSDFSDPERDKILQVLERSREVALQRYEHPIYDTELGLGPVGWYKLMLKTPAQYTPQQFAVFRAVHKWRDDVAREEDESPMFIMPNHAVFSIARSLPTDNVTLLSAIQHVSPVLRMRAQSLLATVRNAQMKGVNGPDLYVVLQRIADLKAKERGVLELAPPKAVETSSAPAQQEVPVEPPLVTPELRAPSSQFWGNIWRKAEQRPPVSSLNINLALPLPPLTAEIFSDAGLATEEASPRRAEHTFVPKDERPPEDERTDIFIVKQLGGGRKRKRTEATEEEPAVSLDPMLADEVMLEDEEVVDDDVEDEIVDKRAQYKQEKIDRRAARKAAKQSSTQPLIPGSSTRDEEPALDYATAPSVLRAQDADSGKKKKDRKKKSVGFNPFAGMGDGPKGLPRAQKERAGKSKTFSS